MFRTTRFPVSKWLRFLRERKRLVLLLTLMLCGFAVGCILFCRYGRTESVFLGRILSIARPTAGVRGVLSALYNSCFLSVLLLGVVFFCGLSACGIPFIWAVPIFFGLGLGMTEGYYYSTGLNGVLLTVVVLLLPSLLKGTALLLGAAEGMRMSLLICGVLTEKNGAFGLHRDLRLYLLRFAVFLLLIIAGGIADTLLRLLL